MKITELRMVGIRCFEDTGNVSFHPKCNVIVGKNNAGKSTLLRGILNWQGQPLNHLDVRANYQEPAFLISKFINGTKQFQSVVNAHPPSEVFSLSTTFQGNASIFNQGNYAVQPGHPGFHSNRTLHAVVPFLAKRKAVSYEHNISSGVQDQISGTFQYLYSYIDRLAVTGHPLNAVFTETVKSVIGLPITMRASGGGKEAGYYFDVDNFVTLDQMGDGVSEMIALIVELCMSKDKIFVLEEPETNLHPEGLKAILALVRRSSEHNQFIVATHSNIVVRELGGSDMGKVFRIYRDGNHPTSPSKVEEVEQTTTAHMELLRELGYEFTDFSLFDAWLFLEESSAERVFNDILIPFFVPNLRGRLRTYASNGVDALEPSFAEFKRLVVFVHLQQVYKNRIWVRADSDTAGTKVVKDMQGSFSDFEDDAVKCFGAEQFEYYYPEQFQTSARKALTLSDKQAKRAAKSALLQEVLAWSKDNPVEAKAAWEKSAAEPIALLQSILKKLDK